MNQTYLNHWPKICNTYKKYILELKYIINTSEFENHKKHHTVTILQ